LRVVELRPRERAGPGIGHELAGIAGPGVCPCVEIPGIRQACVTSAIEGPGVFRAAGVQLAGVEGAAVRSTHASIFLGA
jgi:hypothetical protein